MRRLLVSGTVAAFFAQDNTHSLLDSVGVFGIGGFWDSGAHFRADHAFIFRLECLQHHEVEIQRLRHDRTELYTRSIQPALWLVIFGETISRLHAIPTGGLPYLDYLAPGILAQSGLFIAIFYGIQVIWERENGRLETESLQPSWLIFSDGFQASRLTRAATGSTAAARCAGPVPAYGTRHGTGAAASAVPRTCAGDSGSVRRSTARPAS